MSYTCKYCHRHYEYENGLSFDFCSYDCSQKYEDEQEEKDRLREEHEEKERYRWQEDQDAQQRRWEDEQEESRRRWDEEQEAIEEEQEERRAREDEKETRLQRYMVRAAESGDVDELRNLLRKGMDPNFSLDNTTPLLAALYKAEFEAVRVLVKLGGADPNLGRGWETPLTLSVLTYKSGRMELLKEVSNFKPILENPKHVLWLWKSIADSEARFHPGWQEIKRIFSDKKLYPDSTRDALRQLVFDDSNARQWLIGPTDKVKDCIGIDLAEIQARIKQIEEEKKRAIEEAEEKKRKLAEAEAEKNKLQAIREEIDDSGIYELLSTAEEMLPQKALPFVAMASYTFDTYIKKHKSVASQGVNEINSSIQAQKVEIQKQIPDNKFQEIWDKYCTETAYCQWKYSGKRVNKGFKGFDNPLRSFFSSLPDLEMETIGFGLLCLLLCGLALANYWFSYQVISDSHFRDSIIPQPTNDNYLGGLVWMLIVMAFVVIFGWLGWGTGTIILIGAIALAKRTIRGY